MRFTARLWILFACTMLALAASAASGCAARAPAAGELEPIRADSATLPPVLDIAPPVEAGASGPGKRVTLNAVDADVRPLLVAIAREAGISLVVSDDVRRRVSVSLNNAEPEEALRAIIAQAGLSVVEPRSSGLPPVVYYQLPVNVNQASADVIATRFGISAELARWIVESRSGPAERP